MEKQKNKPTLRFPEFKDKWKLVKIKDNFTLISGQHLNPNEYTCLPSSNTPYFTGPSDFTNDINKVSKRSLKEGKVAIKNDILFTVKGNGVGSVLLLNLPKVVIGRQLMALRSISASTILLYHFIGPQKQYFENLAKGNMIPGLSRNDILDYKIILPSLPEQQKIAAFLTSVDERIAQLTKKKTLLEQYKKGVMQKIFSQEIRFKDDNGKDFPEWEEKRLGEIGTFQTSSVDKLNKPDEKEVFLVNYMNVYRHENINNTTKKYLMVVTAKDSQIENSDLKKGDILFTPSSETPDDIGHSVVIFEDLADCVFSYHLMRFRPNVKIDILYSHYFCNIPKVLNQLTKMSTGSTRFTISVKSFSSVVVDLPCIAEQTKIANFLLAIDKKIEGVAEVLEATRRWKKGLLQQMFC